MFHMTTAMERPETGRVPSDTLALRLAMLRHESGHISQRQAAFRCGITPRVWQGMEEGRKTAGLLDILKIVSDEFGYDLNWLAWGGPLEMRNPRRPDGDGGECPLSGSNRGPADYKIRHLAALAGLGNAA